MEKALTILAQAQQQQTALLAQQLQLLTVVQQQSTQVLASAMGSVQLSVERMAEKVLESDRPRRKRAVTNPTSSTTAEVEEYTICLEARMSESENEE